MTEPAVKTAASPADLATALQKTGYRARVVETQRGVQVQSAAQGIGFFIGFGNPAPAEPGAYLDFSFHCWLSVQGELRPGLVETWNRQKRFARLFRQDDLLVLTMDVMVAGGVTENFLVVQAELWDRVLREFVAHLKQSAPAAAMAAGATV